MEVRSKKVRLTLFYLIVLSAIIGTISIFLYGLINREVLGGESSILNLFNRLPFAGSEKIRGVRVAILQSEQSADYIADTMEEFETGDPVAARKAYLELAPFWERQLRQQQLDAEIITDADLLTELGQFNLLVLPAAYALSSEQVDAVKSFLAQRKGVIMTHITGNRDKFGVDRGWTLTEDVTGGRLLPMHAAKVADADRVNRLLFFAAGNALSAQIAPAYSLPVATFDYPVRINLLEDRAKVVAGWEDPGGLPPLNMKENAGALLGEYRGGRFVWLGFTSHSVANLPEVWPNFSHIITNAVNWAGHRAVVGKAAWPSEQVAVTVGIISDQSLFNSEAIIGKLNSSGFTPGLFISNAESATLPLGAEALLSGVELAPQLNLERIDPEGPLSARTLGQLDLIKNGMQDVFDIRVAGFCSPFEINRATKSLGELDFDYVWLLNQAGTSPQVARPIKKNRSLLFRKPSPPLVFIPQGVRSDQTLIRETTPESSDKLLKSMTQDFQRIQNLGGLYSISLHPQLIGSPKYSNLLDSWIQFLSDKPIWQATPSALTDWWRKYEGLQISAEQEGRRVVLQVSNEGGETIERIRLHLFYPTAAESLSITAERMRTPIPNYIFDKANDRIEITLEDMDPGENRTYFLE
jgi:hypothetical protein